MRLPPPFIFLSRLFLSGMLLVIADSNNLQATMMSTSYLSATLKPLIQAQPQQTVLFLWWNWEVFALGFIGYICFGLGAVALANPLVGDKRRKFRIPNIHIVLLHLMVAGTAGFFTVVLQNHEELSSLLTGGAYLVLMTSLGPDALKIHSGT